jgi:uncharacterized protein
MVQSNIGIGWRHPHYKEMLEMHAQSDLLGIDFLEVHSENFFGAGGPALAMLHKGREKYPISLHGVGLGLGSAVGLDDWHLDQLATLVANIDPIRVSDHACFARANLSNQANSQTIHHAADLLPIPFSSEALNVICANVEKVQDRLQRPIAVENLSAYVTCEGSEMPETAFLNALAQRTSCQLLIDVNIYVNALNDQLHGLKADPLAQCIGWIDAIHPTHVAEIHLAGHIDCGDIVIDDHGSRVKPPVWALYQHATQRFGNTPTLIEWDTDIPALDVLLAEAAMARSYAV